MNEGRESLAEYTARGGVVTRLEPVELELDAALERARAKRGTRARPAPPWAAHQPQVPRLAQESAEGEAVSSRLALALLLLAAPAHSAERSSAVRRQFQLANPCPSTGKTTGACPNHVVDHIVSLCWNPNGDVVTNLMWQTLEDGKKKDVFERQACALKRKYEKLKESCEP
jgi:hypothetical protein